MLDLREAALAAHSATTTNKMIDGFVPSDMAFKLGCGIYELTSLIALMKHYGMIVQSDAITLRLTTYGAEVVEETRCNLT